MLSIRSFLRQAPTDLAVAFLSRYGIVVEPRDAARLKAWQAAVIEAHDALAPGLRGRFDTTLERIGKLASEAGEAAIDAVVLDDRLDALPSRMARALHVYLSDDDGFRRAEDCLCADNQRMGRQWTAFAVAPSLDLLDDEVHQQALVEKLKAHYGSENIKLDIYRRKRIALEGDGLQPLPDATPEDEVIHEITQITIYREDRGQEEYQFDNGELVTRQHKPVIEARITYEPVNGRLECIASRKDERAAIAGLVAGELLGIDADVDMAPARTYTLAPLRSRFAFDTDPGDPIEEAKVSMLRLQPLETQSERLIIQSLRNCGRDIWQQITERLGPAALTGDYEITQGEIKIRHRAGEGRKVRTLSLTITPPFGSNLKERTEIERLIAGKYLARWGLMAS